MYNCITVLGTYLDTSVSFSYTSYTQQLCTQVTGRARAPESELPRRRRHLTVALPTADVVMMCTSAMLLWLLLSMPTSTDAATLPLEGPDAGRVASEPNTFADLTYVTRGTFEKPLDVLGSCCQDRPGCYCASGCHWPVGCDDCCQSDGPLGNSSSMEQSSNSSDPSPPQAGPL